MRQFLTMGQEKCAGYKVSIVKRLLLYRGFTVSLDGLQKCMLVIEGGLQLTVEGTSTT